MTAAWNWAALILLPVISSITIHQHHVSRSCIEMRCPVSAFEFGEKRLLNEESFASEKCQSCQQCTDNGYSVCMRIKPHRARRAASVPEGYGDCSCAHEVPQNCDEKLGETSHPANLSMTTYVMCYLSSLQAPPKPMVENEKDGTVVVAVEPFWLGTYWKHMHLGDIYLNYDYVVTQPEHCEGDVVSDDAGEHLCKNSYKINMTSSGVTDEHVSESYEDDGAYDDGLPPDLEFERDIFSDAKYANFYFKVDVRRERQIDAHDHALKDVTITLESEINRFSLKPYERPADAHPEPTEDVKPVEQVIEEIPAAEDDATDTSEEHGVEDGSDFWNPGNKSDNKTVDKSARIDAMLQSIEEEDDEEDKEDPIMDHLDDDSVAVNNNTSASQEHNVSVNVTDVVLSQEKTKEDSEEEKEETTEPPTTTTTEATTTTSATTTAEEEKEEEKPSEESAAKEQEEESEAKEAPPDEEGTEETTASDADGEEDSEEDLLEGDDIDSDDSRFSWLQFDKKNLSQWVFGITVTLSLLAILCVCAYRKRCCCSGAPKTKTANGNQYNYANRPMELVSQTAEKERLRQ